MKHYLLRAVLWAAAGAALYGQAPSIVSVVDPLTYDQTNPRLAPGSQAAIFGTGFGTSKSIAVTFGGKQAFVIAVSDNEINVQIPVDAPLGATMVTVGASSPFNVKLAQYAPAVQTANKKGSGQARFVSGGSGPFKAGDTFAVLALGLGPTTPAVPTGSVSPSQPPAKTSAAASATIGGANANVVFAGLAPGGIGVYQVNVTVPAGLTTGDAPFVLTVGSASSQSGVTVSISGAAPPPAGPTVTSVVNAASYIPGGLPNSGIAQGSIMVVKGSLLGPSNIAISSSPFQQTNLSGTSVSITVGGTAVGALMYYTSAGQVAALLPSDTPVGNGTVTVTYNGQTSAAVPITVVANNLGIFTETSDGKGAGIVTYPDYSVVSVTKADNCGGPNTTCGAANPGDTLIIWGTGLGPVTGSDAAGAGLGVNQSGLPLTVWLGGVQAPVTYQGRSGCCIGLDQVVFTVPDNAPTGCAVPLAVQIGNTISNFTAIPVASGSRACTPTDPSLTPAVLQQLTTGNGPVTYGQINLNRADNNPGFKDVLKAQFLRFTVPPAVQPYFAAYLDAPPLGTCMVFNSPNSPSPPLASLAGLDAGPQITVNGPDGPKPVGGSQGAYSGTVSGNGTYYVPGAYTVTVPGGADVPAFTASVTIPALPTLISPPPDASSSLSVTRANGLPLTWSGGSADAYIELDGGSATDSTGTNGASFQCTLLSTSGSFTIPPSVLLGLPPGSFAGLRFRPATLPAPFPAVGLNFTFLDVKYDYVVTLTLK